MWPNWDNLSEINQVSTENPPVLEVGEARQHLSFPMKSPRVQYPFLNPDSHSITKNKKQEVTPVAEATHLNHKEDSHKAYLQSLVQSILAPCRTGSEYDLSSPWHCSVRVQSRDAAKHLTLALIFELRTLCRCASLRKSIVEKSFSLL